MAQTPSWFFGGPDAFDAFHRKREFPPSTVGSTPTSTSSVEFTCSATGTVVLWGSAVCTVDFTCTAVSTFKPVITIISADGGGYPTKPKEPYKPRVPALALSAQYDALLESGIIEAEEWLALYLIHRVDPLSLVPA